MTFEATTRADRARDFALVRRVERISRSARGASLVMGPLLSVAQLGGSERLQICGGAVKSLAEWAGSSLDFVAAAWAARYHMSPEQECKLVSSLWRNAQDIGTLHGQAGAYAVRDVLGVPVICPPWSNTTAFIAPETREQILRRARNHGQPWLVTPPDSFGPDSLGIPDTMSAEVVRIVERTRKFTGCRRWLFWGPPRGGKSVAARQVANELCGTWTRVSAAAAVDHDVWSALHILRPPALILDDLDVNAGNEGVLLDNLERAGEWATVIISTINVLPSQVDSEVGRLRGAMLAPGRAADEKPVEFRELDHAVAKSIAPDVPDELRHPSLLAAYAAELQRRADAGVLQPSDLDEMLRRMEEVGDR